MALIQAATISLRVKGTGSELHPGDPCHPFSSLKTFEKQFLNECSGLCLCGT